MHRHLFLSCFLLLFSTPLYAEESVNPIPFGLWLEELKLQAKAQGIDEPILEAAFDGVIPNEKIIALDRKQPEGTKTFTQYLEGALASYRIKKGRTLFKEHKKLLTEISKAYHVQPEYIVALWGIETSYGGFTGNFSVIEALTTLAYDGRRSDFFRTELLNALTILQAKHITPDEMKGSWAGAMGQSQFMPSSFLNFAVDFNEDGKQDIWNTVPDVFASIANYLYQSGWNDQVSWGAEVNLPQDFDFSLADVNQEYPLKKWEELGIKMKKGTALNAQTPLALVIPGEPEEGAYLVTSNYRVLLKWNRSKYFATAVSTLANRISK